MNNMGAFAHTQWQTGWAYNGGNNPYSGYTAMPSYTAYLPESMELYSTHHRISHQSMSRTSDTKPRLSKEEVEILETEFQKNHKPNSSTKKALAESMGVDNARINNWFQNRRAREKKEKNIREYAAKQKLDKDKTATEPGEHPIRERHIDLVASSAPFPDPRPVVRALLREPSLSSDLATPEHEVETPATTHSEAPTAHSSPSSSTKESSKSPLNVEEVCDVRVGYFTPHQDTDGQDEFVSGDFLSASDNAPSVQTDDLSVSEFSQYPQLVMSDTTGETTTAFSDQEPFGRYPTSDYSESSLTGGDDPQSEYLSLKSPPAIGIASRRNRRPPHLALSASRSYSAGIPRIGMDTGRRDVGHSMRRVASATGTGRISKASGTPRSPFFDRNAEALFQLNRSPNFTAITGTTIAPPTPDTPLISSGQQGLTLSCPLPLDEKYPSELAINDPTLRTPPTTPGIMENMFALDSAYDMAIPDEPLVTPGLGGFPNDFQMPGMSTNVPNYIANTCASQPQTPSFAAPMGPTYFGYSGGNAEYNWSDASLSARSSPAQSQRHVQFMNMTPSSFTHTEK